MLVAATVPHNSRKCCMEDDPAKFLLAGHRGGSKTTESRRLEQYLNSKYTVICIDTVPRPVQHWLCEVLILIGIKIFEKVIQRKWGLKDDLLNDLLESLKTVVYQDEDAENTGLELPEIIKKLGVILKQGLTRKVTTTLLDVARAYLEVSVLKNLDRAEELAQESLQVF